MRTVSIIRCTLLALSLVLPAAVARAEVKVTHKPVEVEHKAFDHNNPPKDLLGEQKETAITVSEFDLKIGLDASQGPTRKISGGKTQQSVVIERVNITLGLKITVWLPDDATEKLKAHEEGHRQMAEKIYAERADKAAKAAGVLIDGRRLTAVAEANGDIDKALEQKMGEANKTVYTAYLSQTSDVSARVNDIYDEITQHATRLDIDEKTAITQAFARLAEEAKSAATKPTTHPSTNPAKRLEQDPLQVKKRN